MEIISYFIIAWVIQTIIYKFGPKIFDIGDVPDKRKIHTTVIPRIGGFAIFVGFLTLSLLTINNFPSQYLGIYLGIFVIVAVGLYDDIFDMPAIFKLLGQICASLVTVLYSNITLYKITLPFGIPITFDPIVGIILSVIWITAIINAVNLLDGLDGLAAGFGIITIITIMIISINQGNFVVPLLCMLFLINLIIFLMFNFNPAKVFLGDTGSMQIGFFIGIISLLGYKSAAFATILIPVIILFVPFLDAVSAIIRRHKSGNKIHIADKMHIHHAILDHSSSHKMAVLKLYGMFFMLSISSLAYYQYKWIGIGITTISIATIIFMFWRLGVFSGNK